MIEFFIGLLCGMAAGMIVTIIIVTVGEDDHRDTFKI